jgi:hypothetical protein
MTLFEKMSVALGIILFVLVAVFFGAYWWSTKTPHRPKQVASNAVFLWAPYVGFPAPRRGWWLSCSNEAGHDLCRLSDIDGNTEYHGEFVTYGTMTAIPESQLRIDPKRSTDHKIWVGDTLVPLVYLTNGDILIPRESYGAGVRLLEHLKPGTKGGAFNRIPITHRARSRSLSS